MPQSKDTYWRNFAKHFAPDASHYRDISAAALDNTANEGSGMGATSSLFGSQPRSSRWTPGDKSSVRRSVGDSTHTTFPNISKFQSMIEQADRILTTADTHDNSLRRPTLSSWQASARGRERREQTWQERETMWRERVKREAEEIRRNPLPPLRICGASLGVPPGGSHMLALTDTACNSLAIQPSLMESSTATEPYSVHPPQLPFVEWKIQQQLNESRKAHMQFRNHMRLNRRRLEMRRLRASGDPHSRHLQLIKQGRVSCSSLADPSSDILSRSEQGDHMGIGHMKGKGGGGMHDGTRLRHPEESVTDDAHMSSMRSAMQMSPWRQASAPAIISGGGSHTKREVAFFSRQSVNSSKRQSQAVSSGRASVEEDEDGLFKKHKDNPKMIQALNKIRTPRPPSGRLKTHRRHTHGDHRKPRPPRQRPDQLSNGLRQSLYAAVHVDAPLPPHSQRRADSQRALQDAEGEGGAREKEGEGDEKGGTGAEGADAGAAAGQGQQQQAPQQQQTQAEMTSNDIEEERRRLNDRRAWREEIDKLMLKLGPQREHMPVKVRLRRWQRRTLRKLSGKIVIYKDHLRAAFGRVSDLCEVSFQEALEGSDRFIRLKMQAHDTSRADYLAKMTGIPGHRSLIK